MKDRGFALVALMFLLGAGSLGVLVLSASFPTFEPHERERAAEARVQQATSAALATYFRDRAAPSNLVSLAADGVLDPNGDWQNDPFGAGADFDYALAGLPASVTIRSVGRDGTLGNADDISASRSFEPAARALTRSRLAILRAAFLRSRFMFDVSMTAGDAQLMRSYVRDWSVAQRSMRHADAATLVTLTTQRDSAATNIANMRAAYGLTDPIPSQATGGGGLLTELSLPDSLGTDGFGQLFETGVVGFTSLGGDATGGTSDDM